MKFLIIASYPDSILKFRGVLIQELNNLGFKIHIAVPELDEAPEVRTELEALGYKVHNIFMDRTGTNPISDFRSFIELFILMLQIRPKYIIGYTIKPVIYGLLAGFFARIPHRFALITGLGYTFQSIENKVHHKSLLQRIVFMLYSFSLSHAEKVFFQNPDDQALFRSLKLLKPDVQSIVVNGSGVDIHDYNVTPLTQTTDMVGPVFLLIARLLVDKGVREYAAAAKIIKNKYPNTLFNLVGWIDKNPNSISQSELDEWIADGRLTYLGKLSDVRSAITQSSVYVLPSYREGTPRTVLEAMAMGRAIITQMHRAVARQSLMDLMVFWFLFNPLMLLLKQWNDLSYNRI
jgi:glycosyltransferase involved in cell wall biosynthesis